MFYFGDEGERGWVHDSHLIPYDGKPAFDKFCQEMIALHWSKRRLFEVAPSRLRSWNSAVSSADVVCALTPDERLQKLTAMFQVLSPPESSSTTPIVSPAQKKRRRVLSDETPDRNPKPPSKRRRRILGGDTATEGSQTETRKSSSSSGLLSPASSKRNSRRNSKRNSKPNSTTASEECNAKRESSGAENSDPGPSGDIPNGFDSGSLAPVKPDRGPVRPDPFTLDRSDVMSSEAASEICSTEEIDAAKLIADKENLSMATTGKGLDNLFVSGAGSIFCENADET